jgi:ABC-type sugar transport system permease subunit
MRLRERWTGGRLREAGAGYVLILPLVLASGAFLFVPIVTSAYWSFTDFSGLGSPTWVGLRNYTELFADPRFIRALVNTIIFVLLGMSIGPTLGLLSALLLNREVRFRSLFRTAYFLPVMTSLVVVATIWKILLNERGILNSVLGVVGVPAHAWLAQTNTALPAVTITSIWQGFGFETVVFLAALQAIPRDLYDAAHVDGAGAWRTFRHITLPGLRSTILFVYIYGIIGSFQVFDQVFVMTQGGPIQSTTTVVFRLYQEFYNLNLGKASAIAYVLVLILAAISFVQLRIGEERD